MSDSTTPTPTTPAPDQPPRPQTPPVQPAAQTRTLTLEEYRTWVHEQVVKGVILRLGAVLGASAVAVLVAVAGLGWNTIDSQVRIRSHDEATRLVERIDKNQDRIGDHVNTTLDRINRGLDVRIRGSVASTLIDEAKIREDLQKKANEIMEGQKDAIQRRANQALEGQINSPWMATTARGLLETEMKKGLVDAFVLSKLKPVAVGAQPASVADREQALRFMKFFAPDDPDMRTALIALIDGSDGRLREVALQSYRPSEDIAAERDVLRQALTRLTQDDLNDVRRREYVAFFARLPTVLADDLLVWLTEAERSSEHAGIVGQAFAAMKTERGVQALVRMIEDSRERVQRAGWSALGQLDHGWPWMSDSARREGLRALSDAISHHSGAAAAMSPAVADHLERVRTAILENDRAGLLRLGRAMAVVSDRRLERLHQFAEENISRVRDSLRQNPLYLHDYVAEPLDVDRQRELMANALGRALKLDDWKQVIQPRLGTQRRPRDMTSQEAIDTLLLAWARLLDGHLRVDRTAAAPHLKTSLSSVVVLPDCLYAGGTVEVLRVALRHDADGTRAALQPRIVHLYHGDRYPGTQSSFRGEPILFGVDKADSSFRAGIFADVRRLEPPRHARFATLFQQMGEDRRKKDDWNEAVEAFGYAVELNPAAREARLGRARAYLALKRLAEAEADLAEATRQGVRVSEDVALEFVRLGNGAAARRAVEHNAQNLAGQEKALALENLGLYFVRVHDWAAALAHTDAVRAVNEKTEWNSLVRAIAAHELGAEPIAREATQTVRGWSPSTRESVFRMIGRYIPAELAAYRRAQSL